MKLIAGSLLTMLLGFAGSPAPVYDAKTEVGFIGNVSGVRETSKGELKGVYLTVKTKNEEFDVYLGPSMFVDIFGVNFKKGAEVTFTGSKVKFEDQDLILAREVHIDNTVLILRDAKGIPQWLWMLKRDVPTGL
jgi:hypothetical protein